MTREHRIRRVLLPCALTASCIAGALGLGVWPLGPSPAVAQEPVVPLVGVGGCSNTECQGTAYCRYVTRISCAFEQANRCVNTGC